MGPFVVRAGALTQEQIDAIIHRPWPIIALDNPADVQVINTGLFDRMEQMQTEDGGPYMVLVAPQAAELAKQHFGGRLPKWIRVVEQVGAPTPQYSHRDPAVKFEWDGEI